MNHIKISKRVKNLLENHSQKKIIIHLSLLINILNVLIFMLLIVTVPAEGIRRNVGTIKFKMKTVFKVHQYMIIFSSQI